jgi:hypothetical protein
MKPASSAWLSLFIFAATNSLFAQAESVLVLPDDWSTQGQWPGRYGRRFYIMCGMSGRWDYTGQGHGFALRIPGRNGQLQKIPPLEAVSYKAFIGENAQPGDGLRAWIHWATVPLVPPENNEKREAAEALSPTAARSWEARDVPRVLMNPVTGLRRQSDYDDHAEAYQPWFFRRGPNLYVQIDVPSGPHIISFYFMNKDGDQHVNRFRDYTIHVKEASADDGVRAGWEKVFDKRTELARTRVHQFRGGVYKRFFVPGLSHLTWKIAKGLSLNTILQGVFVDPVDKSVIELADLSSSEGEKLNHLVKWRTDSLATYLRDVSAKADEALSRVRTIKNKQVGSDEIEWLKHEKQTLGLAQIYHDIAQFDLRDRTIRNLCTDWKDGLRRNNALKASIAEDGLKSLTDSWRRMYIRFHGLPWLSEAVERVAIKQYCQAIAEFAAIEVSISWLKEYAMNHCIADSLLSETIFQFVEEYLFPKAQEGAQRRLSKKELYASGLAARQLQNHARAVQRFELFAARYPRTSQRWQVTEFLDYHREQHLKIEKLRYPDMADKRPNSPPKSNFDPVLFEAPALEQIEIEVKD